MKINWQPMADLTMLKQRSQILADIRLFFVERDILEVDTPILSQSAPTAPYLDSFSTDYISLGSKQKQRYYLQTSPEFTMKRLLAAGSGAIYQIAKVFRNGEQGKQHSPEFTMLEWYRPELNLDQLMAEVDVLLQQLLQTQQAIKFSYQQIFNDTLAIDIFDCSDKRIEQCGRQHITSLTSDFQTDRDGWLELLMSYIIEPKLAQLNSPVFIVNFPASQAQLAKIITDTNGNKIAARFELYSGGIELANGYDELLDANELQQRFEQDNQQRQQQGKIPMPIDQNLLAAMQAGLPPCTGVALGLDRLIMLVTNKQDIKAVQTFTFNQS